TGAVAGVTSDRLLIVYDTDVAAATARVASVTAGAGKGFGTSPQWQDASKHLPKDSNAIVYLDVNGLRGVVEGTMSEDSKKEYEQSAAPFLRPFKYLTLGTAASPGPT